MAKNHKKRRPPSASRRRKASPFSAQLKQILMLQQQGQLEQAEQLILTILKQDSDHIPALLLLAKLYIRSNKSDQVEGILRKILSIDAAHIETMNFLAEVLRTRADRTEAKSILKQSLTLHKNNPQAHFELGRVYLDLTLLDDAIDQFKQALQLKPRFPEATLMLAEALKSIGNIPAAEAFYRKALTLVPDYPSAYMGLAKLIKYREPDDDLRALEKLYHAPNIAPNHRLIYAFTLGKIYQDLQEYRQAFEYFSAANALKRATFNFSIDTQRALFNRHKEAFNSAFSEKFKAHGIEDDSPIFILGMPRSGTSLVEQILASHSLVHGAGEVYHTKLISDGVKAATGRPFPEAIETLAPQQLQDLALAYTAELKQQAATTARYICDKLPHNFLRIGFIATLMPNAKIIHCQRNPMDNCLSIFTHDFSAGHGYASDLQELGSYYQLYEQLMAYWQRCFPDQIYTVNYESLVSDPATEIPKLLNHCKLEPEEACLNAHQTQRVVNTPSAMQVREPMYTHAVQRWKHYEAQLQPLIDALQE